MLKMPSTFETLPDEILMIIFQYSGDVNIIFQTFLGLNQRLNNILIDKRLHLLTDFLYINVRDDYYNSKIFQQVSQQLLSLNTAIDEKNLSQILQPLLTFHIQQKYIQLGYKLQSSLAKFESIRQQFTNDEILKVDHELQTQFINLRTTPITMEYILHMKSLVLTRGARIECDDYELCQFNLAKAVNERLLDHINDTETKTSVPINSLIQLFETLIISNPSQLKNRDYVGNGGCHLQYFVVYALYRLRSFYYSTYSMPVNMKYYRATVDLCLFVIQAWKQMSENEYYLEQNMFDVLEMVPQEVNQNVFIQTVQCEIYKIVIDEYIVQANKPWEDYFKYSFRRVFRHLIKNNRLDVIKYICHCFRLQDFFNEPKMIREYVNLMTRNQLGRRLFSRIMDDASLGLVFSRKDLIFILLDKKERKLLEKIFQLSPCLIHQLDEDGNDPLLYICLKVSGCRHRIIEFLIKMGSDLQRRNYQGQNFTDILQLQRNKKLLRTLFEHEII
jgi:hypothetical protein